LNYAIEALLFIAGFGLLSIAFVLLIDQIITRYKVKKITTVYDRRKGERRDKPVIVNDCYVRAYEFEHVTVAVEDCARVSQRRIGERRLK